MVYPAPTGYASENLSPVPVLGYRFVIIKRSFPALYVAEYHLPEGSAERLKLAQNGDTGGSLVLLAFSAIPAPIRFQVIMLY